MKQPSNKDFLAVVRKRIAQKQYDDLFSGGCCYFFALRSFEKGIGSLAYTKAPLDPSRKGHVFVVTTDGRAFDHKGYRTIDALKQDICEWGDEHHFPATKEEIEQDAIARGLTVKLKKKVNAIADEIIAEKA